ncbi:MAG: glycine zipper domain-containing protein [Geminicoccaceae bacterium]|nr:glycine zipper domain-containing protein [Geminicoccaceae bacterium]MCX8101133.1 glycine zipper domain-containing protein [Geminicoccaceae bacterium]MDW8369762.1 glycine zipper domain-containing protein [Geminicoccaceae bacterium]
MRFDRANAALGSLRLLVAGALIAGLAACEQTGGGTASPGVGTAAGAAAGAGVGRLIFGNSTTGMLIGAGVGGLAGNMTVDRQREERLRQEREAERDAAKRRQLEFERQRRLQQAETEREIEERALFEQWRRERGA